MELARRQTLVYAMKIGREMIARFHHAFQIAKTMEHASIQTLVIAQKISKDRYVNIQL